MDNGALGKCADCQQEDTSRDGLTWRMTRQDIVIGTEEDILVCMAQREGLSTVMIFQEDGEILIYSLALYCDNCIHRHIETYEECHTPSDKMTRRNFRQNVSSLFLENDWSVYSLQLDHLAPMGFPNMAAIREDRLLFASLRGDVTVRHRSFHLPKGTLLISPEVPEEIRESLTLNCNETQTPSSVTFLYMDEKYADTQAPSEAQTTSLTGLLVGAETYPELRKRLFACLPNFHEGARASNTPIHASDLFRDRPDKEHFAFYGELVAIVKELGCRIYKRGFNFAPSHQVLRKNQNKLLGLCFRSMLIGVTEFEDSSYIWPVMETDHSDIQDQLFAGYVRWMDHATAHLNMIEDGVAELIDDEYMVDNARVGDLHYVSKRSIVGSAVDCLTYLLHYKWLSEIGYPLAPYKKELARIASNLGSETVDNFVGSFRLEGPR